MALLGVLAYIYFLRKEDYLIDEAVALLIQKHKRPKSRNDGIPEMA